ncbi:MAG TPA: glycosyltransferase, partial [Acidimicrobiales bacterium]|nr:glycosyltransferase [Acidimicrobiales bacterium]
KVATLTAAQARLDDDGARMTPQRQPEMIVFSHLRWTFVWQRPQHLISRLARRRHTWFVEEPWPCDVAAPRLCSEGHGDVTRLWLEVPADDAHIPFDHPAAASYGDELAQLLGEHDDLTVWLYTPMALSLGRALRPSTLVYDVMDDLASFRGASAALALRHRQALRESDVVFTGGRSLHRGVLHHRAQDTHLFASGVEPEHYSPARRLRQARRANTDAQGRPVAGYVGVIDERVDLDLVAELAAALPDWDVRMVGPLLKIDPSTLPQAPNLTYPGPVHYADLPATMAGFDVALMPFALNEATRSISPTKTLEYLAAGLPVVSTRVPDVVADHSAVVELEDDGEGFAAACRRSRRVSASRDTAVRSVLSRHHWDTIAHQMDHLMEAAGSGIGAAASREDTG